MVVNRKGTNIVDMSKLDISGVSVLYNKRPVLNEITVAIPEQQLVSIIGPNGAGKSTLLSVIGGILQPTIGQVRLDGTDLFSWKREALAKRVALLRQTNQINLKITVRELVSFGRFPYSHGRLTAEDETICDEAMSQLGVYDMRDVYIDALSGGERQRAFIAMTLAQDTPFVLLDEPLNNLDMRHSLQIMRTLRRLVDEFQKTIILVIHDINFAAAYSDYMIALKQGRLVAQGLTEMVVTKDRMEQIYDMTMSVQRRQGRLLCDYFL